MAKPQLISSFVNGRFLLAEGQTRWPVILPATGEAVATLFEADISEVDHAAYAAQKALPQWRASSERDVLLEKIGELIVQNKIALSEVLAQNTGLSRTRAYLQIERAAQYFAPLSTHQFFYPPTQYSFDYVRESVGVIAIVCGWHNVFQLACQKISIALRLGNCVVLKPSEYSAQIFFEFFNLIAAVGLPRGVLNLVNGRDEITGRALVNHVNINTIVFAGRAHNAQEIALQALRTGKEFIDASSKKPTHILLNDAPFESALAYIFSSVFLHPQHRQGVARILIHAQIASQFMTRLAEMVDTLITPKNFLAQRQLFQSVAPFETTTTLNLLPYAQLSQDIDHAHRSAIEAGGVCFSGDWQKLPHSSYPDNCTSIPTIWMAPTSTHLCNDEAWHGCALTLVDSLDKAIKACVEGHWAATSVWSQDPEQLYRAQAALPSSRLGLNTLFDHEQIDACDARDDFDALSHLKICARSE